MEERPEEQLPACPEPPGARAGQAGMGKDRQVPARARVSPHARAAGSHGVVENNILLGQFQQHGVVEELADAHVLTQALQGNTKPGLFPIEPLPREPTEETLCPAVR